MTFDIGFKIRFEMLIISDIDTCLVAIAIEKGE